MSDRRIPYRIEQTKNRHSRAVYKEDTIVIRLAKNLSGTERSKHIDSLLKRMTVQVIRSAERTTIDPFRALLDGASDCSIRMGSGIEHAIALSAGKRTSVRKTEESWNISVGPTLKKKALHRLLWKTVAQHYHQEILERTQQINMETLHVKIQEVRLQHYMSQWGSCAPNGTIALNTALLFLPKHLLHYVVVHELAHRKHANHSAKYWNCVNSVLSTYKEDRKELRSYKLLPI